MKALSIQPKIPKIKKFPEKCSENSEIVEFPKIEPFNRKFLEESQVKR